MIKRNGKYLLFITGLITCFFSFCCAQEPVIKTSLDKNKILIGEQFKLKVEAIFSAADYKTHWLTVPDSLQHFEVIDRSKLDSDFIDDKRVDVSQTFTMTSFDSGQFVIPSFNVSFNVVKNDSTLDLPTDSLPVTISYSPLDTTNHFKEIKPIREVETSFPLWQWIIGTLLILLLIIALIWYFRNRKKNKPKKITSSNLSAYEEAITELQTLKKTKLSNPTEIKLFHSKLAEIFKTYLSRTQNSNYKDKTTSDILIQLNSNLDKKDQSELAAALRSGDAVKFAKYIPPTDESTNSLLIVKKTIELFNK
jgi:hypothetical protein